MSMVLVSRPPQENVLDQPRIPKFSAPAHPSLQLLQKLHVEKLSPPLVDPERDPHEQPVFTQEALAHPVQPILYLPPLISSLPQASSTLPHNDDDGQPLVLTTETRLPNIDPVSLSLHRALHHFRPLNAEYARTSYRDAFNWSELRLPAHEEREWYCVAFRSRRKEGSNGDG